jgi:hypothetical protein
MKTKVDTPEPAVSEARGIVYVRPVAIADLPEEVQQQAGNLRNIYAVHAETGERLALVRDQRLAFILARQNDMAPVHVH